MRDRIKILGILNIVLGSLGLVVAFGIFVLSVALAGPVGFGGPDGPPDGNIVVALGFFLAGVLAFISLAQLLGGWGLINHEPWARVLMIVVSMLNLLDIPIGTVLGVCGLFALLDGKNEVTGCK